MCHRLLVRYIIHLYCLAVQAGFYSDEVECSTLNRRVPGLILTRGMEIFLRVCDRCIRTLINHSQTCACQDRSIVHKPWAYQDSNKSSQVIGISVLLLIIRKTWAYQLRHDQSFARLGFIKIPINHSQDFSISRLQSIVHKTWAYKDSDHSFTRLWHIRIYAHYELHMPVLSMNDQSLVND